MASPWRISMAEFLTTVTTRRWRIGFLMAAHGGRFCHVGVLTDIGDIEKSREKTGVAAGLRLRKKGLRRR